MKKIITFLVLFSSIVNMLAQETVTKRSGQEITVNAPATTTTQGVVKLAGDLGGTADVPTVPALTNKLDGSGTINYISKFTAAKTLGNSLLFDDGTNVGLGTTTPISKFEISGISETFTGNGTVRISNNTTPTINNFAGLVFKSNNVSGTGGSWKIGSNQETNTGSDQNFHFLNSYNGSTYASKMTLTPTGNLGIGTTAPANKLEITQGTAGNSGLRFTNLNSSSTATTSSSKVLAVNSTGDVILTNVPGTQNIVAFSVNADPRTVGTTFSPNTQSDPSVVYQSTIDNSMWTYNGTSYVTYTAPASTAWNLANTTNDAGSNKTSGIFRTGNVGIGNNNPTVPLDVQSPLVNAYVVAAKFLAPNNTTAGNATQLNFGVAAATGNSADWRYVYQGNGATSNRVDFGMSSYAAPMLSYLNSGNVGIGTTAPATKLQIQGQTATTTINADAQLLRFSRPGVGSVKWDHVAQFNLGAYSTNINANTRLDLALNDGATLTPSNVMTWQANGNVGIGTSSPSGGLTIFGPPTSGLTATILGKTGITKEILFGRGGATNGSAAIAAVDEGNYGGGLAFFTKATGSDNFPTSAIQAMNIDWLGNVGIGNTTPSAPLVVQGKTSGAGVLKLAAPTVAAAGDNWWMGFNNGTVSTDATDRARIGVDIVAGGSGRLFFTTGAPAAQTRAMFIDESQRVGIGTSTPTAKLDVVSSVTDVARITTSLSTTNYAGLGIGNASGTWGKIAGGDSKLQIRNFSSDATVFHADLSTGNIGIGTTAPVSKLEVNGSATNTVAYNSGSATAILFNNSNLAYTSASPGAFNLQGMKDGGTYTLAVQGTTSGTSSFSGLNPSGTAFTFLSVNNGVTIATKQTLYTFIVMGTTVYYYMATGF